MTKQTAIGRSLVIVAAALMWLAGRRTRRAQTEGGRSARTARIPTSAAARRLRRNQYLFRDTLTRLIQTEAMRYEQLTA